MTLSAERITAIEIPSALLESPAVRDLTRTLTSTGELSAEAADGLARGLLKTMLAAIGEWYATTMARDIKAVMQLREQLTLRYKNLKRVTGSLGGPTETADTQSYQRLFDEMVGYIDHIATARETLARGEAPPTFTLFDATREAIASGQVPPEAEPTGVTAAAADEPHRPDDEPYRPPDEPPSPMFERLPAPRRGGSRAASPAEAAYDRELSRILRRLDPPRGRRISPQRAAVLEVARFIHENYLGGSGIPRVGVTRQPASGAHLAADIALSRFDSIRDLGYEMWVELPPDLRLGGQESVHPDGWSFNGNRFEWLEWKEPEAGTCPGRLLQWPGRPAATAARPGDPRPAGRAGSSLRWVALRDPSRMAGRGRGLDGQHAPGPRRRRAAARRVGCLVPRGHQPGEGPPVLGREDPGGAMSSQSELDLTRPPSAVLSDGLVSVPLWAVGSISVTEAYQLPPVGSAGLRAVSQVHDDTLTISATLPGPDRFAWKLALEQLAEASRRGTALGAFTGGRRAA